MPLHKITGSGSEIEDVYATDSAARRLPRYRIPKLSSAAQPIYDLVHDELLLDGNSSQNLATFCTTWSEPEGRQLMADSINKNMIDKTSIRRPQRSRIAACTCSPISGTRRGHGRPSVARPPVRVKPACSAVWR